MSTTHDHAPRIGWRALMWGGIAAILLLPAAVMPFTDEVDWTAFDFVAASLLLGFAGLLVELTAATIAKPARRAIIVAAIAVAVLVVWAHGAVGIF